jgi:glucosylceramidase
MSNRTRRDFLKIAAAGAAVVQSLPRAASAAPAKAAPAPVGGIDVRVTSPEKRYAAGAPLQWQAGAGKACNAARIAIDPRQTQQPIVGFGASFTDAACYMISQMPEPKREALLRDFFDPKEMGFEVARSCIGSSDYATKMYSYAEGEPDPELKRFSIEHDKAYILPTIRRARALNPRLFLMCSPWSPPGWMKDNNSMIGGTIRGRYLESYGNYFVKFLQAYKAEGVEVNAVSSQNEVDTEQDSRMPACLFPQEVEVKFISQMLGPAIEKAGLNTKILMIDHNYNLWGRALAQLEDPDVAKYSRAIAWHGYIGKPEWMKRVSDAHPDVEMIWSEGGPDIVGYPAYATDWAKWGRTFAGILRNGCRAIIGWNLVLDESGKPNIGPFPCGGVVTVNSKTHEVTHSGQYWAFAHYSKSIKRDALIVSSEGSVADVEHVAARNADGRMVVVLTNSGKTAQGVELQLGGRTAEVTLPADSVTTLSWA